jgi:hypothetical protein
VAARGLSAIGRFALIVAAPALLIGVLSWPMLFTNSGLGGDWEHHLWYVWNQSLALRADGSPSLFLSTPYSIFYPQYLFYGGTINVLAAMLSLIPAGTPTTAYVCTYVMGYAAAYGGWYWAGRIAGLSRLVAHGPALLYITSACYLTLLYGEGDWPAFLAASVMPLMVAAALSILRAERVRLFPACALAISTVVFFGSHNITMLWGSTLLAIASLLVVACVPQARRLIDLRGLARVACVFVPAALVNAWFLLPTVVYAANTKIVSETDYIDSHYGIGAIPFTQVFTLSRAATLPESPDYALSLPALAIGWLVVSIVVVLWSARRGAWVRVLSIFCALTAAIVVMMTHNGILSTLPSPYTTLQFSYRLETYILIGVSASVLATLVLIQAGSRRLRLYGCTLVPILAVSLIGAVQQVNAYQRTSRPRAVTFTPGAEVFAEIYDDYGYAPLPVISGKTLPLLKMSPQAIHDNRFAATVHMRPGQLAYTNIGGGPDLLHISGARVVGRDAHYHLVLAIGARGAPSATPRTPLSTERIAIAPAQRPAVVLGRVLSLGALAVLALELSWYAVRGWRRRRFRGELRGAPR